MVQARTTVRSSTLISLDSALQIAGVALVMVLSPGPNMLYLVSRSITQGRTAGLISLTGVAAGFFVYLVAATVGIAAVFTLVPTLYTVIKVAGVVYLLYLAWKTLKPGGQSVFEPTPLPPDPPRELFSMGLATNLLNPKIAILYVTLLPQVVKPELGNVALQSLLLGLIQITIALTVNAAIVMSASSISGSLARRPSWLRVQRYVMGTALGGIAVQIAMARPNASPAVT